MVGFNFIVLLFSLCFLPSFCEDEKPSSETVEIKEIKNSGTGKPAVVSEDVKNRISPSLRFEDESGKTSVLADSFKVSLEEKSVEIEQQDLGKTKEVNGGADKEDGKKVEHEGEKVNEQVKQDDKKTEDEHQEEEKGIDLKVLNDKDFEHLTQAATGATTGDWLVLFTKKDGCDDCNHAEKVMKVVYERMKHKLNVAKVVEGRSSKMTFKRFSIKEKFPVISLFHHGKKFSYENSVNVGDFIKFLEGGFELAPWSTVREPYTFFEFYVEESTAEIKDMLRYKKNVSFLIFVFGFICGISVTSLCGSIMFHLLENFKDDDEECIHEQQRSRDEAACKEKPE